MRAARATFLLVVLLSAATGAVSGQTPAAPPSWEPTWNAMYAAWQKGGEPALRAYVKAHRRAVSRELLADIALRGLKERADAALSEARLAIARAAAQELGDRVAEATAVRRAGEYSFVTGKLDEAKPLIERALEISESAGDLAGQGWALGALGRILSRTGDIPGARSSFEKAIAVSQQAGSVRGEASAYSDLGEQMLLSGEKAKGCEALEKAMGLFEQAGDTQGQATAVRLLGVSAAMTQDWEQALAMYEKAGALYEKAGDLAGQGRVLNLRGEIYRGRGDHDQAEEMYARALPLYEKAGDLLGQGNIRLARGSIALVKGDVPAALALCDEALPFYERAGALLSQGQVWLRRGQCLMRIGRQAEALAAYEKAYLLSEKTQTPMVQGNATFSQGLIYHHLGDGAQALAMFERALPFFEKAQDSLGQGQVYSYMGQVHARAGRYAQALTLYDRARPLLEKARGQDALGALFLGRGHLYLRAGDHVQALAEYEQARAHFEKNGALVGQGVALMNRGDVYYKTGDAEKALAMYEQALVLLEKAEAVGHQAEVYQVLGDLQAERGDDAKAFAMYEKALSLFEKDGSSIGRGLVLRGLGALRLRQGDLAAALDLYVQAIDLLRLANSADDEAEALAGEAKVHARAGRNDFALQRYEQSIELLEQVRRSTGLEGLKLSFLASKLGAYDAATAFMLENGYGEQAFRAAERMKARVFLDRLAEGLVDLEKGVDPELKSRRDALESRSSALGKQRSELFAATLADEERTQRADALTAEIEAIEKELAEVKDRIRLTNPLYASVQYPQAPSTGEIWSVLRENEALLVYVLTGTQAWCFVLTRGSFDVVKLPGTPMEIATGVASVVGWAASAGRGVQRSGGASQRSSGTVGEQAAARLHDILIAPVASKVAGKTLIIVPDGVLGRLPFEMLTKGTGRRAKPLMRSYEIRYTPSAAVLAFYRTTYRREGTSERFVGFGDPVYDHESFAAKRAERGVAVAGSGLAGAQAQRGLGRAGVTLARLPETGEEVRAIDVLFGTQQGAGTSFLRLDASEERAKSPDLAGYGYIHFAAHGILDDEYQAIALSQVPDAEEDGLLTLPEIMNLDWNARLVVLSACETGLGPVRRGEGVTGLTRAVMYAGSPAAVVSLWSVSDEGTKELMTRFYGAMVGDKLAPADALRQAKLEMAASSKWRSPYYWAAFVLYGE